jgi:hypothetical protein
MLPILMLMDWAAGEVVVFTYTPVVHCHIIEGPSKKTRTLVGPQSEPHIIEGPSKKTRTLVGSN